MRQWFLLFALALPVPCAAVEPGPPGLELLEYLGGWEQEGDTESQWVDPVEMYRAGLLGNREQENRMLPRPPVREKRNDE